MKRLPAILCFMLLLAVPVSASEADLEHIDELAQTAVDTIDADPADHATAKAGLYAAQIDPATLPSCRVYIDTTLVTFTLLEHEKTYPGSSVAQALFDMVMEVLPAYRNDCLLAI